MPSYLKDTESWSHWRAKLRDWAVRPVRAGCYSWAALPVIDSKTVQSKTYNFNLSRTKKREWLRQKSDRRSRKRSPRSRTTSSASWKRRKRLERRQPPQTRMTKRITISMNRSTCGQTTFAPDSTPGRHLFSSVALCLNCTPSDR